MSRIKIEYVKKPELREKAATSFEDNYAPVVRLEALRAWLEAHQYPRQYGAKVHNGVIDDLLDELKDKP